MFRQTLVVHRLRAAATFPAGWATKSILGGLETTAGILAVAAAIRVGLMGSRLLRVVPLEVAAAPWGVARRQDVPVVSSIRNMLRAYRTK